MMLYACEATRNIPLTLYTAVPSLHAPIKWERSLQSNPALQNANNPHTDTQKKRCSTCLQSCLKEP